MKNIKIGTICWFKGSYHVNPQIIIVKEVTEDSKMWAIFDHDRLLYIRESEFDEYIEIICE